jgi:hypothetical protein
MAPIALPVIAAVLPAVLCTLVLAIAAPQSMPAFVAASAAWQWLAAHPNEVWIAFIL